MLFLSITHMMQACLPQCLAWLRCKVHKAQSAFDHAAQSSVAGMTEANKLSYTIGFIGEYLNTKWQAQLAENFGAQPAGGTCMQQLVMQDSTCKVCRTLLPVHPPASTSVCADSCAFALCTTCLCAVANSQCHLYRPSRQCLDNETQQPGAVRRC